MDSKQRQLGQTGIEITPIGLGVWQFSEGRGGAWATWAPIDYETTNKIVQIALDGGINWFDTAELYGGGRSERRLSAGLQAAGVNNGSVVVATKWQPLFRRATSIKTTLKNRQDALSPYGVDLHQVHFPYALSPINAQMEVMADLVSENKIRAVGVSNFSAQQMREAHEQLVSRGISLASNQVKYSLLDRRIEKNGVLEAAKELGITIIAYSPLEMGLLTGKFHNDPGLIASRPLLRRVRMRRRLESSRPVLGLLNEIAEKYNVSVSQVVLNWTINFHGETIVAIPGASKPSHAQESAGAMDFELTRDEMMQIDYLTRQFMD